MKQQHSKQQNGFTILELMIATVVVSVILLLVTIVMINLQNLYNKGVNQENIQNDVSDIVDTVSQQIQDANEIEGSAVTTVTVHQASPYSVTVQGQSYNEQATCIGSTQYLYVIGAQVGSETQQGLWQDTTPVGGCGNAAPDIITTTPTDNGTEYIPTGARLTDFQVIPQASPDSNYAVYVSASLGTDGSDNTSKLINLNYSASNYDYGARCITNTGDQFCATSSLSTEVGQRLQ